MGFFSTYTAFGCQFQIVVVVLWFNVPVKIYGHDHVETIR